MIQVDIRMPDGNILFFLIEEQESIQQVLCELAGENCFTPEALRLFDAISGRELARDVSLFELGITSGWQLCLKEVIE